MKIELEIEPFQTPNFVRLKRPPKDRAEGWTESPAIALSELDEPLLTQLCDQFRKEVFKKAGKQQPPICVGQP